MSTETTIYWIDGHVSSAKARNEAFELAGVTEIVHSGIGANMPLLDAGAAGLDFITQKEMQNPGMGLYVFPQGGISAISTAAIQAGLTDGQKKLFNGVKGIVALDASDPYGASAQVAKIKEGAGKGQLKFEHDFAYLGRTINSGVAVVAKFLLNKFDTQAEEFIQKLVKYGADAATLTFTRKNFPLKKYPEISDSDLDLLNAEQQKFIKLLTTDNLNPDNILSMYFGPYNFHKKQLKDQFAANGINEMNQEMILVKFLQYFRNVTFAYGENDSSVGDPNRTVDTLNRGIEALVQQQYLASLRAQGIRETMVSPSAKERRLEEARELLRLQGALLEKVDMDIIPVLAHHPSTRWEYGILSDYLLKKAKR